MVDLQFYMCVLSMRIIVLCPCASLLTKMAGNSKREEFDDVSSITHETHSAIVHGRVIELSPVKTSRKNQKVKYFDCKLTDGKEVCRMVSFELKVWPDIEEFVERGESVSVVNCDVKKRKIGGTGYELVLSDKSSVIRSPKKFKLSDDLLMRFDVNELERIVMIEDISTNVGNKVSVKGKLVSLKDSEKIKTKDRVFTKRESVLSDESTAIRLVLWEKLVESVELSKSYSITNLSVKTYGGQKYLSTTDISEVKEISEIVGAVHEIQSGIEEFVGDIVGIVSITKFYSCILCAAKVTEESFNSIVGCCGKCGLKQKISRCKKNLVAQVLIENQERINKTVTMIYLIF